MASFSALFSMIHGLIAAIFLMGFTGAIVDLLNGSKNAVGRLKLWITSMLGSVWFLWFSGTFIYIAYRAPGGPRELLKAGALPWLHEIIFELKEFSGAFVPLFMIVPAYLIWYYKEEVLENRQLRNIVITLLIVAMLWTLGVFGAGALVTKYAPIP